MLQLVFTDLRDVIFERLYRFHVQSARLELVLQVGRGDGGHCVAWLVGGLHLS